MYSIKLLSKDLGEGSADTWNFVIIIMKETHAVYMAIIAFLLLNVAFERCNILKYLSEFSVLLS